MASQLGFASLCYPAFRNVSHLFTGDDVAVRHAARLRLTNPPNVAATLIEGMV